MAILCDIIRGSESCASDFRSTIIYFYHSRISKQSRILSKCFRSHNCALARLLYALFLRLNTIRYDSLDGGAKEVTARCPEAQKLVFMYIKKMLGLVTTRMSLVRFLFSLVA
ncbi:hypothetical protein C8F04DRAFT_1255590 [Mycena alexandri]|uniref:Uncharacterized protein n=1 Tax=Mycena alexandri TaxID=1745969 RepID=A0AAD6T569_9AGAR|nr:hypothetical protein C8F04DRAFT_1255590 [Mycena alexandri]